MFNTFILLLHIKTYFVSSSVFQAMISHWESRRFQDVNLGKHLLCSCQPRVPRMKDVCRDLAVFRVAGKCRCKLLLVEKTNLCCQDSLSATF